MLNRLLVISLVAVFAVSCSSKKKKSDGDGPEIVGKEMNFSPQGSDGGIDGLYSINFAYDQAALTSDAKNKLKMNAEWMKANQGFDVQIEGHCDERGSVEYNLALGERRAKTVQNYLASLGVSASKLKIVSYGEEKPVAQGDTEDVFGRNRRANFVPLPR